MEYVNGWCFRGIYKGGLWEDDLHVSARLNTSSDTLIVAFSQKQSSRITVYRLNYNEDTVKEKRK